MGYCKHHAILVTDVDEVQIRKMHKAAQKIFKHQLVSEIVPAISNGYITFMIAPDGSKEGWETSNEHDDKREKFFRYLANNRLRPDIVEVWYDENGKSGIVRGM